MQILDLLGMYFDAVVVEVEKSLLFFQIGHGHTVLEHMPRVQSSSKRGKPL